MLNREKNAFDKRDSRYMDLLRNSPDSLLIAKASRQLAHFVNSIIKEFVESSRHTHCSEIEGNEIHKYVKNSG